MMEKRNKILFFLLNLVVMGFCIFKNRSLIGAAGAGVIFVILYYLTVHKPAASESACRNLPLMVFLDGCTLLVLFYQELRTYFTVEYVFTALGRLVDRPMYSLLILIGIVMCFIPLKGALGMWSKLLGKVLVGMGLLLVLWCAALLPTPMFFNGMGAFFLAYLLFALAWCFLCAAAYIADPASFPRNNRLTWILLAVFVVICLTESTLIGMVSPLLKGSLIRIPDSLAWWKAAVAFVVLVGFAAAMCDYENISLGPDALMASVLAGCVLLVRMLLNNSFLFIWAAMLLFLIGSLFCLRNEKKGNLTLRLASPTYLIVHLAILILAAYLLRKGLWVLAVFLGVYGLVFYVTAERMKTEKLKRFRWLVILSCPAVLTAGYLWRMRFLPETLMLIAAAYVVLACTIVVLSWKHPGKRSCPDRYKWVVFGLMVVLCAASCARYGTKIDVSFQRETRTASIEMEARGEDNRITSASYQWRDWTGEPSSAVKNLPYGHMDISVEGDRLLIVVTDLHGATTAVTDWYPSWLPSWV